MVFGTSAALALIGASGATFAGDTRLGIRAAAASLLGVAGVCLTLGSGFVAAALIALLVVLVPAVALAAVRIAPPPEPDVRPGAARPLLVALLVIAMFAGLGWLATQTAWPPAGGTDTGTAWLGWRLLTDEFGVLLLGAALLGVAGLVVVAALRTRGARARRAGSA